MKYLSNKSRSRRSIAGFRKRGTACVEMAIVLPIMFLITLGTLETCEGIFLIQKVKIAAFEGASVAVLRGGSDEGVENAVSSYLDARGVKYENISSVVSADPSPELANELDPVRVTVTIPTSDNFRMPTSFYRFWTGGEVSAEVVMFKESATSAP